MKGKVLLGLVMLVSMFFLVVPSAHADLTYNQAINDKAPFWHELLLKLGLFSVTGYTGTTEDQYCRSTWECVKTSDGLYRYDCYNSGLSSTSCLCSTTADSSKCATNQPGTGTSGGTQPVTTNGGTQSCIDSDGSNGQAMASGTADSSIYSKGSVTTTSNGYTNVFQDICEDSSTLSERACQPDGSVGTWQFKCSGGCSNGACVGTQTGCQYHNPDCPSGQSCSNNQCVTPVKLCNQGASQCSSTKLQFCDYDNVGGTYWKDITDCGTSECNFINGVAGCGNAQAQSTSGGTSPTKCSTDADCILNGATSKCISGTCSGGSSTKIRSITDDEIKQINDQSVNVLSSTAKFQILSDTSCASASDCQSNQCTSAKNIGLTVPLTFSPAGKIGFCYSGKITTPTPLQPNITGKSVSLTYKEWTDTSAAQRLKTLCKTNEDCAAYSDVAGTGKEYTVACNSARTNSQLQDDVNKVCQSTGADKYLAIGGGASGAALGCAGGAAAAGIPTLGLGALPGCIIGAIAGGTIVVTTVEGIHNTLQVNCKQTTIPPDVGACIATPKGFGGLDALTETYTVFGAELPLWLLLLLGIILLVLILGSVGGKK